MERPSRSDSKQQARPPRMSKDRGRPLGAGLCPDTALGSELMSLGPSPDPFYQECKLETEGMLCPGLQADAGCKGGHSCEHNLSPPTQPWGTASGLKAKLLGLRLSGPNWGQPRTLGKKPLSEVGGPRIHTQAADPVQPRVRSCALGFPGSWSHQPGRAEGAVLSQHRKATLGPSALCYNSSGCWCPVLPARPLRECSAGHTTAVLPSFSQRGLCHRCPKARV